MKGGICMEVKCSKCGNTKHFRIAYDYFAFEVIRKGEKYAATLGESDIDVAYCAECYAELSPENTETLNAVVKGEF
jgi:hypothetical protein